MFTKKDNTQSEILLFSVTHITCTYVLTKVQRILKKIFMSLLKTHLLLCLSGNVTWSVKILWSDLGSFKKIGLYKCFVYNHTFKLPPTWSGGIYSYNHPLLLAIFMTIFVGGWQGELRGFRAPLYLWPLIYYDLHLFSTYVHCIAVGDLFFISCLYIIASNSFFCNNMNVERCITTWD